MMQQKSNNLLSLACFLGAGFVLVAQFCPSNVAAMTEKEKKKLQEENRALRDVYNKLFHRDKALSPEEALTMLEKMKKTWEEAPEVGNAPPIDFEKFISYANVTEEKCLEPQKVINMRHDFDMVKLQYPALMPFVGQHFTRQFELCNFHIKYREDWANFREANPRKWGLMSKFKGRVAKFGKISKNWRGGKDTPHHLNSAFTDMYEEKKEETPSRGRHPFHRGDAAIESYNEMGEIIEGAHKWKKQVTPGMELATYHLTAVKEDEELRDGLRHNNVYDQVTRTNFEPSMSRMFADAFYDKDDKAWTKYQNMASLFNV